MILSMQYSESFKKRFWSKMNVASPEECWPWKTGFHTAGYGQCYPDTKTKYAHRVAFEIAKGEIPEGMSVLHKCDNPPCCNPDHLFLGTRADNMKDMDQKGRRPLGIQSVVAKITDEDVVRIRILYHKGGMTQKQIGKMYGLCQTHIGHIVTGRKRRSVPMPNDWIKSPIPKRQLREPAEFAAALRRRLTEEDRSKALEMFKNGSTKSDIARVLNFSHNTVAKFLSGKTWKHLS